MTTPELWHNPRCSKSRATLALLEERGVHPRVVKYLEAPPSRARLAEVMDLLGDPHALVRAKEAEYAEHGLSSASDREALLDALVAAPRLIERPVLITERGAAIGRPPEQVLAILPGG